MHFAVHFCFCDIGAHTYAGCRLLLTTLIGETSNRTAQFGTYIVIVHRNLCRYSKRNLVLLGDVAIFGGLSGAIVPPFPRPTGEPVAIWENSIFEQCYHYKRCLKLSLSAIGGSRCISGLFDLQ